MNYVFKYSIHKSAHIGLSFVLSDKLVMKEKATIKSFTVVKNINNLEIGYNSRINSLNWITGINYKRKAFIYDKDAYCEMVIGDNTRITPRHSFDCNGGIYIGNFTTIAGSGTQFLSHSVDVFSNKQTAGPIRVGDYCFVSTSCILLKNSQLPSYSVLAAGAILNKFYSQSNFLYGGIPAKPLKELPFNEVKYFTRLNPDVSANS